LEYDEKMQNLDHIRQTASAVAREAGDILRRGWGKPGHIGHKGHVDLVTEYDTRSEALIVSSLRRAFPDHAIYAEEQGAVDTGSTSPYRWMIDPLDGTTNFAHGFPVFAVSLALTHHAPGENEGQPLVGVVYDPIRDECYTAARGQGAILNGQPIHVSDTPALDVALLATGFPYDRRTRRDNNTGHFCNLIRHCQGIRRAGSAALDLAYVACGRLDGFWEMRLHAWDVAAGVLLVQEAGGQVSDLAGGPDYLSGEQIVASNGPIHDEMLTALRLGDAPVE
jgi:myo-inositol-1(or 4)-monophosphatase